MHTEISTIRWTRSPLLYRPVGRRTCGERRRPSAKVDSSTPRDFMWGNGRIRRGHSPPSGGVCGTASSGTGIRSDHDFFPNSALEFRGGPGEMEEGKSLARTIRTSNPDPDQEQGGLGVCGVCGVRRLRAKTAAGPRPRALWAGPLLFLFFCSWCLLGFLFLSGVRLFTAKEQRATR